MSKFTDTVTEETPRLVVMFRRDGDNEQFQWGIVGKMPLMSLIGCVARIQTELALQQTEAQECDQLALVIAWSEERHEYDWFVHVDIPICSLIGMLELVKAALVGSQMARQAQAQQVGLVGPNGRPIIRR